MTEAAIRDRQLTNMLAWYRDMGVDVAVAAEPVDWLERGPTAPAAFVAPRISPAKRAVAAGAQARAPALESPTPGRVAPILSPPPPGLSRQPALPPTAPAVTLSDEAAEANARDAARQARTLDDLETLLRGFDGCGLKKTAKHLCFYRGAPQARVMIIGEAPGADEDRSGIPFVGRAGQLLDKMLAAIDLSEADTHITNVVYWRPPGNRVPTPQETLVCRPFLERQIRLVNPELIVTVGGAAAKLILGVNQGIMKTRGKWGALDVPAEDGEAPMSVTVMPTLHPAYLLRSPAHKRHAWRDLLAIRQRLDGHGA